MSIIDDPVFEETRPYWQVDYYERDATPKSGPRYRLELRGVPRAASLRFQQIEQPCVACGNSTRVFRQRKNGAPNSLYFAPCCPLDRSKGCSRGLEASDEYARVRAHLEGNPLPPTQDGLFDPKQTPPTPKPSRQEKDEVALPEVFDGPAPPEPYNNQDCAVCRRPALCACQAPLRNGTCGKRLCESCATSVHHASSTWLLCPKHASEHFQGCGPLWVRRNRW